MDYLVYLIFRVIVAFLQVLPEKAAYAFGRGLLFLVRIFRVRVNIVRKNLQICFPELSKHERERILKKHYRYLGEMLVEATRLGSMNRQEASSRLKYDSHCHPDNLESELQSVICWSGHLGCVDYGPVIAQSHPSAVVYRTISNPYLNEWVKSRRSKWGLNMIQATEASLATKKLEESYRGWVFMIGDHNPGKNAFNCDFFRQKIRFAVGPEVFSRRLKKKMVYARMERVKPGYYRLSMQKLQDAESHPGSITQQAVTLLEADIRKNPEYYFWMHNRFKHIP